MNALKETFEKSEKLCSYKAISTLFESGNIFYSSIFKIVWARSSDTLPYPAQVAFSVSKKRYRLAVTRNLLKRRMREAYRKNKKMLYEHLSSENIYIIFVIIMIRHPAPNYLLIDKSMKEMINKLITVINEEKSGVT